MENCITSHNKSWFYQTKFLFQGNLIIFKLCRKYLSFSLLPMRKSGNFPIFPWRNMAIWHFCRQEIWQFGICLLTEGNLAIWHFVVKIWQIHHIPVRKFSNLAFLSWGNLAIWHFCRKYCAISLFQKIWQFAIFVVRKSGNFLFYMLKIWQFAIFIAKKLALSFFHAKNLAICHFCR